MGLVTFVGINDVSKNLNVTTQMSLYFSLQSSLYQAGTRNFVFYNVPPFDRTAFGNQLPPPPPPPTPPASSPPPPRPFVPPPPPPPPSLFPITLYPVGAMHPGALFPHYTVLNVRPP